MAAEITAVNLWQVNWPVVKTSVTETVLPGLNNAVILKPENTTLPVWY